MTAYTHRACSDKPNFMRDGYIMYLRIILFMAAMFAYAGAASAADAPADDATGKECMCAPEGSDCKIVSRKVIYGRNGIIVKKGEIHIGLKDQYSKKEAFIRDCPADINQWIRDEMTCRQIANKETLDVKDIQAIKDLHCRKGLFYCGRKALLDKYKDVKAAHDTILEALKVIYSPEIQFNETMEEMDTRDCTKYILDPDTME